MDLALAEKACVVTGASRGIGLATSRALCAEGAFVILAARDEGALSAAAELCASSGGQALPVALDVTGEDAGTRLVAAAEQAFGGLDVVVNNAGTSTTRPLDQLADHEWEAQWDLNVMAPLRLMRAAAPVMASGGGGQIVNVSSSAGKRPGLNNAAYSVTKTAQLSLSRVFADAWAPRGVRVNAVAPGPVATDLWTREGGLADQYAAATGSARKDALEAMAARVPIGRLGTDDEIAAVILMLCSARSGFVTGSAWSIDGGYVPLFI